jgi:hypothetical protein
MVPLDVVGRRHRRGHFAPATWNVRGDRRAPEVAINPALFTDPESLLTTMLHEAAHALLFASDIGGRHVGGVSATNPYYHRRTFRDACIKLGLECRYHNRRYGWTITDWPATGMPEQYRGVVRVLARLPFGGGTPLRRRPEGRPPPPFSLVRLRCACTPARTILVARSKDTDGISCTRCQSEFQPSRPT